jgi:hypothetical protein
MNGVAAAQVSAKKGTKSSRVAVVSSKVAEAT